MAQEQNKITPYSFIKEQAEITSDAEMALIGYHQWLDFMERYSNLKRPNLFTEEERENLLVTALEGGSNYWYLIPEFNWSSKEEESYTQYPFSTRLSLNLHRLGLEIDIQDVETEEHLGKLSLSKMIEGEWLMLQDETGKAALGNILSENWDAETADVWFQFVVLGKIVYG